MSLGKMDYNNFKNVIESVIFRLSTEYRMSQMWINLLNTLSITV